MKFLKILFFTLTFSVTAFGSVKEIVIESFNYGYKPQEVILEVGKPIKITLTSSDGHHGLSSRELGFNLKADTKESDSVEITPNKPGEYKARCSVPCGSGHSSMFVTFIVK